MHSIMGRANWALHVQKLWWQFTSSKWLQSRTAAHTMFTCHQRYAATRAPWIHDTLCLHARAICTLLLSFSHALWSVSLPRHDSLYAVPARKSKLHPIAVLQPAPLKWVLKLQRINRTTVVSRSYSQFYSVCDWWWAKLDCYCRIVQYNDHLKRSAGKIQNVRERQPFLPQPHDASDLTGANKFGPWNPGGQNWRATDRRYTIATSTRQPVNVGLAQARPNYWRMQVEWLSDIYQLKIYQIM